MKQLTRPTALLFDLDGTLADTAPDLAFALNTTLAHYGRTPLAYGQIRPVVSHGAMALVQLGFGMTVQDPDFEERRQFLLQVYARNLSRGTRLFPGMPQLLDHLDAAGIRWGIVTNKPAWLTEPLVVALGLDRRAGCVVSGDTCTQRKPHPEPVLHGCRLLGCVPQRSWYLGDAGRDMQAGRAAGCTTIGALYGYLHPEDSPADWDADLTVDHVAQLQQILLAARCEPAR